MKLSRTKCCIALLLLFASGISSAQNQLAALGCGSLQNAYGPYDYLRDQHKLGVVERYHFTPALEQLRGNNPGADFDYTLRAFPNHHRALMAMMRLGARQKVSKPRGAEFTTECYMLRAEAFRPNDAMVKVIFGMYLTQSGRQNEAVLKFEEAKKLDGSNANIHYNLGLAYFDLKRYDDALESAHIAYSAGFPLPGLREKLKRAGRWRDAAQN